MGRVALLLCKRMRDAHPIYRVPGPPPVARVVPDGPLRGDVSGARAPPPPQRNPPIGFCQVKSPAAATPATWGTLATWAPGQAGRHNSAGGAPGVRPRWPRWPRWRVLLEELALSTLVVS